MSVSALVLTLNEEVNLHRCLDSLRWCDDIVILDSGSTDGTERIAYEFGARFVFRKFDHYAAQRNYGLTTIKYKHPWILMLDADEVVTPEFESEMREVLVNCDAAISLFRFRRKDYFLGRWIRRSSGYPTWFGRLVRIGQVHVEREINEEYVTDGKVAFLQSHVLHYPFNKGISAWVQKHDRYSTMEAEMLCNKQTGFGCISWRSFLSSDPVERRRVTKSIVYALPGRPLIIFFLLYILRGGFLDGKAGFTFSLLRAFYEFLINIKVTEIKLRDEEAKWSR